MANPDPHVGANALWCSWLLGRWSKGAIVGATTAPLLRKLSKCRSPGTRTQYLRGLILGFFRFPWIMRVTKGSVPSKLTNRKLGHSS
jgi:hypothetical protein